MSTPTPIRVIVDDRIRLLSAALAATSYPQQAQERKRHFAHAHARATLAMLQNSDYTKHPAIVGLQGLLDAGTPLEALYTLVMLMDFPGLAIQQLPPWAPPKFNEQLWDFYNVTGLKAYWEDENNKKQWDAAESQAQNAFREVYFQESLEPFIGDIAEEFVFMPNILYPANENVSIRVGNQLIAIIPPPLAWGESIPWPYDEETRLGEHTFPSTLSQYARLLMRSYLLNNSDKVGDASSKDLPVNDQIKAQHPTWEAQFTVLFMSAIVAIYLEDFMSETEARGYMVMEKKVRNMTILPGTVSVLRRFLQEKGNRYETLADFLTVFPIQLKVARRIVTL